MKGKAVMLTLILALLIPAINAGHTVPAPIEGDTNSNLSTTFYLTPMKSSCTNNITLEPSTDILTVSPDNVILEPEESTIITATVNSPEPIQGKAYIDVSHKCTGSSSFSVEGTETVPLSMSIEGQASDNVSVNVSRPIDITNETYYFGVKYNWTVNDTDGVVERFDVNFNGEWCNGTLESKLQHNVTPFTWANITVYTNESGNLSAPASDSVFIPEIPVKSPENETMTPRDWFYGIDIMGDDLREGFTLFRFAIGLAKADDVVDEFLNTYAERKAELELLQMQEGYATTKEYNEILDYILMLKNEIYEKKGSLMEFYEQNYQQT